MAMKESLKGWAWEETVTWGVAALLLIGYVMFFASLEDTQRYPLHEDRDHVQSSE